MNPAAPYAGFWRRFAASWLDGLLLVALLAPLMLLIYGHGWFVWVADQGALLKVYGLWDALLARVVPFVAIVLLWTRRGATPGKLLMGCRIVDARTGRPPRPGQAALRLAAYAVSALPLYLGFAWIGWDRRKQGWHDKLAGTVVLYRPDAELAGASVWRLEAER